MTYQLINFVYRRRMHSNSINQIYHHKPGLSRFIGLSINQVYWLTSVINHSKFVELCAFGLPKPTLGYVSSIKVVTILANSLYLSSRPLPWYGMREKLVRVISVLSNPYDIAVQFIVCSVLLHMLCCFALPSSCQDS